MRIGPRGTSGGWIKRVLPRSLLGRSLLMILLPLVLLQAVALQFFYGSHLDVVSRRLTGGVAGELAYTLELLNRFPDDQSWILRMAHEQFDLVLRMEPGAILPNAPRVNVLGPMDDDLAIALQEKVRLPFTMDWTSDPFSVLIRAQLPNGVVNIQAPRKRLYTGTIYVFVLWLVGTALLLFCIAALFMRNQVRAIRRTRRGGRGIRHGTRHRADQARGSDGGPPGGNGIQPDAGTRASFFGAADRNAGRRVARPAHAADPVAACTGDDAAAGGVAPGYRRDDRRCRGNGADDWRISGFRAWRGTEQAEPVNLSAVLEEVAAGARRSGAAVEVNVPPALTLPLRADAVRRAITNLVDNARRHAHRVALAAMPQGRMVFVTVDDDGPGIPPDRRESVFRPFESDAAGGTGLGLTIARDIVRAHGGEILLEDSPLGGLRARIRLPV